MRLNLSFAILLAVLLIPNVTAANGDALDDTLELVGLKRADLGWTPKAWWPRFPDVPYKLRAFDALVAEPLDSITYTRALAQAAYAQLDPEQLDTPHGRTGPVTNLFRATQSLGIDPKFGGFRGYTANVLADPTPLDEALLMLLRQTNHPSRINTFDMDLPYPKVQEKLAAEMEKLPEEVSPILGQLVLNIIDAQRWAELAFRKVDMADRLIVARRYGMGEEMVDAYDYCPQVDDVARVWDEASMWYAGQKCVQALDHARIELKKLKLEEMGSFAFDWETPWGWIHIRGTGDDQITAHDALLIVDLGGNDRYMGAVAASAAHRPLGLLLDMAGDDTYVSDEPAQGAGLCGVGVLIDNAGNDEYRGRHYVQGVGQFGLGLCADLAGDDKYFNKFSGQGCGYFGIGLLFDVAGNDQYELQADGQGLGGVGGVGVLADRDGNDRYTAIRENSVTGRPSYHSPKLDVAVSNAQGCGMGRRGDGADGHAWAGGLGALLDGGGDDVYTSGNWCMGTGYWFGIGVLHDANGDDEYHGVAYTQGTGAHFCIGVMIDEAGDDQHLAEGNSHLAMAWAHDFTIGICLDVAGDDLYRVRASGLAYSVNRSVAMVMDLAGNDTYESEELPRPGFAAQDEKFRTRDGVGTYFADTTSLSLFLDIGGEDHYWTDAVGNNRHWTDEADSANWADRNFSIGVDRAAGQVDFTPRPQRVPTGQRPKATTK